MWSDKDRNVESFVKDVFEINTFIDPPENKHLSGSDDLSAEDEGFEHSVYLIERGLSLKSHFQLEKAR